ncbi:MAG: histidine phosphatase family protein [Rhodoferax sp.]|nr:histidine phosphatase family protein [Rhodoferax sp.]
MTVATRIIAVRHGETDWNVDTRIQGQLDIDLNARGHWQAQRVAMALAEEAVDAIYSSDLKRAHSTALAIARYTPQETARQVQLTTGLRERGFGVFEGQTFAEIADQWPEDARRWRQREPDFAPPGGETLLQLRDRVASTLEALASQHLGQQIVLVAHGGIMDALYRLATQQDIAAPRTWELGNASINRLLWSPDTLTLVGWSDTRHLDDNALDEIST